MKTTNKGIIALVTAGLIALSPIFAVSASAEDLPADPTVTTEVVTPDAVIPEETVPVVEEPAPVEEAPVVTAPTVEATPEEAVEDTPDVETPVTEEEVTEEAPTVSARAASSPASAPSNLGLTNVHKTGFTVVWNAAALNGGTLERYEIAVNGIGTGIDWMDAGTGTSYVATGLEPNTEYFIGVRAITEAGAGMSGYLYGPEVATNGTPLVTVAPVTDVNATIEYAGVGSSTNYAYVSWTASADATSYRVVTIADGAPLYDNNTSVTEYGVYAPRAEKTQFEVYAVNAQGESSVAVTSIVLDQPTYEPGGATITEVVRSETSADVTVRWDAPVDNGGSDITKYYVYWTQLEGDNYGSAETGAVTSYTISSLTPGTYVFEVRAYNGTYWGPYADSYYFDVETVAPSAPLNVAATSIGTDLTVTWDDVAYNGGEEYVTYTVYATDSEGNELSEFWYPETDKPRAVTFEEIVRGETYSIIIVADNATGTTSSDEITYTIGTSVPAQVNLEAYSSDLHDPQLLVAWKTPDNGGKAILGYTVTLTDADGVVVGTRFVTETSTIFTGLKNSTEYTATVVARNANGDGDGEAGSYKATTEAAAPVPSIIDPEGFNTGNVTITVNANGTVTADVFGATAGEWFYAYAYSSPTALGWAQVDANGNATWNLAGAGLAAGQHTLVVYSSLGDAIASAPFTIAGAAVVDNSTDTTDSTVDKLASTGTDPSGSIFLSGMLLLVGIALIATRRRKATVVA